MAGRGDTGAAARVSPVQNFVLRRGGESSLGVIIIIIITLHSVARQSGPEREIEELSVRGRGGGGAPHYR